MLLTKDKISTPLDGALYMAARGLPVVPIAANAKAPVLFSGWQGKATTDKDTITNWAQSFPCCNWAACYSDSAVCVDVDNKPDADGLTGLATLLDLPALANTLELRTPKGGVHLIYRSPHALPGGVNKLGHAVDVRGRGMYSLCPGSVVDGKAYVVTREAPLAEVPAWLAVKLGEAKDAPKAQGAHVGELDTPYALSRAVALAQTLPPAIEGQAGDAQAIRAINRVCDEGLSFEALSEIMHEHYLPRCSDPTETDWFDKKLASAYGSKQHEHGSKSALIEFEPLPELTYTPAAKPSAPAPTAIEALSCFRQLDVSVPAAALPPRDWVIQDVSLRGSLTVLGSPGGVGKSTWTLNVAICMALGRGDLLGLNISERRKTLIINREDDATEQQRRVHAFCLKHSFNVRELDGWLHILEIKEDWSIEKVAADTTNNAAQQNPNAIDLNRFAIMTRVGRDLVATPWIKATVDYITAQDIGFFIVDPFVEIHDADENSNAEVARVAGILRGMTRKMNIGTILVHHTKKRGDNTDPSGADGIRGAGALVNAARVVCTLFPMSEADAEKLGVPKDRRFSYIRLDGAKANYSHVAGATWYQHEGVQLGNGDRASALSLCDFAGAVNVLHQKLVDDAFEMLIAAGDKGLLPDTLAKTLALGYHGSETRADLARLILKLFEDTVREASGYRVTPTRRMTAGGVVQTVLLAEALG